MKKLSILILLIGMISCTKELDTELIHEIEYEIPVYEQESVSHYEIEVSSDGFNFIYIDEIPANNFAEFTYKTSIDVTRNFTGSTIYSRIKSVDIDGKFAYSPILTNRK